MSGSSTGEMKPRQHSGSRQCIFSLTSETLATEQEVSASARKREEKQESESEDEALPVDPLQPSQNLLQHRLRLIFLHCYKQDKIEKDALNLKSEPKTVRLKIRPKNLIQ